MDCKANFKGSKWDDVLIKFEFEKQTKPEILQMIADQPINVRKVIENALRTQATKFDQKTVK